MTEANEIKGRKNLENGAEFERRVRKHLEASGWFVSRFQNNVFEGAMGPSKWNRFRSGTTGFPDLICWKKTRFPPLLAWEIIGVECKINGYVNPEERGKLNILLVANVFDEIHIAKQGPDGEIILTQYHKE